MVDRQLNKQKVIMRGTIVILCTLFTNQIDAKQCVCASETVPINRNLSWLNYDYDVLTAPDCLPYRGDQRAITDGRIYAHVDYRDKPAWVITTKIYIKDCNEPFTCVCAKKPSVIRELPGDTYPPVMDFIPSSCLPSKGQDKDMKNESWTEVTTKKQSAWVKTSTIAFQQICREPNAPSDPQLPGCPAIITRKEWGARSPSGKIGQLPAIPQYVFIHHGATAPCSTREDCIRMVKSYQNYHMDGHGWFDIGYSFLFGEDGNVYEGRGWDRIGAHTYGYNSVGLGFCVIGNFMKREPNTAALKPLQQLIRCAVTNRKIKPTYTLLGHRDVGSKNGPTSCPGDKFYSLIKEWPHFNSTGTGNMIELHLSGLQITSLVVLLNILK